MRKTIANWLVHLSRMLYPQQEFTLAEIHVPRKVGIGYHITKRDVREYRKHNPQFKSYRVALAALVEDTKKEIVMNIMASIVKNEIVHFDVKKSLYVADVTGKLYVYAPKKEVAREG